MNTLRRVTRHMVKAVAAGAVLVAAGLPVAMAGTAGAATSPTITSETNSASNNVLPVMPAGGSETFTITGTNFAFDNGPVTGTTNASGTSVSITENSTTSASVTVSTSSTTAPGFYSLTLTDDNGSATINPGFGVDPASTATAVTPSTVPQGTNTLMTVTGTGLLSGNVNGVAPGTPDAMGATFTAFTATSNSSGTFYVNTMNASAGGDTVSLPGGASVSFTITGATITSIAPSGGLVMPLAGSISSQNYTISGTGFLPSAVVTVNGSTSYPQSNIVTGVTIGAPVVVNSTTISIPVTINNTAPGASTTPTRWDVAVQNPNGTASTVAGGLGYLEPGLPVVPSVPSLTLISGGTLSPGANTVVISGSAGFPLSTGSTVTFSYSTFSFTGTVTGFDASGNALVSVYLPNYLSTTLTAAAAKGATSVTVASTSGIVAGSTTLTFASTLETTTPSVVNATTGALTVPALANAYVSGAVVQFPISNVGGANWTLSVNNGAGSQTILGLAVTGTTSSALQFTNASGAHSTVALQTSGLAPGTYTFLLTSVGANLTTGTKISFLDANGANSSNLTGTVVATSGDTATITVTEPSTGSTTQTQIGTLSANTVSLQNTITLTNPPNPAITAGASLTVGPSTSPSVSNAETVTVASTYAGGATIPLTTGLKNLHYSGEAVYVNTNAQPVNANYTGLVTNAAGVVTTFPMKLVASDATISSVSPSAVGSGAVSVPFVITGMVTDSAAADYVVTSTTPGVTFGPVTGVTTGNAGTLTTTISVAAGTAANANVNVTVEDLRGSATFSSASLTSPVLAISAAPTVSAVSAMGTLVNGESATFTVTGTGFQAGATVSFSAVGAFGGHNAAVAVASCSVISATLIGNCVVTATPYAPNGTFSLTVTNPDGGTSNAFASALSLSAPTIGTITPTVQATTYTLSNLSGFSVALGSTPSAYFSTFNALGGYVTTSLGFTTTYAGPNSVTVTVPNSVTVPAGGSLVITLGQYLPAFGGTVYADAPATGNGAALAANNTGAAVVAGQSAAVTVTSADLPNLVYLPNYVFMPGATVSAVDTTNHLPVAGLSVSGVTVLPGYLTLTVAASAAVSNGVYDLKIMNPDGGVAYATFSVVAAPTISAVNATSVLSGPVAFLAGSHHTLTITGSGFQVGAVVTASNGVATFGASTVTSATSLTVTATFESFTGASPIIGDLVVTNPGNGGVATASNELQVNPQPAVTGGPYYVATFTTNTEMVMTGTGFEAGMTVTSSNAAYTVSVASVSPTAVTLLVSTSSAATSGTSTTLTFTNPDGGTTTAQLNGGPTPSPVVKKVIKVFRVTSAVWTGKRTVTHIVGRYMYGQPRITSNVGGTRVQVSRNSGANMTIIVTVAKNVRRGVHIFTVTFKHGQVFHVSYNQR